MWHGRWPRRAGVEPRTAAKTGTRFRATESPLPVVENIRTPRFTDHRLSVEVVIRWEPTVEIAVKVPAVEIAIKMMRVMLTVKT